ncbi:carbohydrate ABC transporter permease [Nocardia sp. NPDC058058]|uniref:carbohydrate ABC transporter permease n=1 Tax=Nocardia sp. NPDC058058 TaxID=3346317 RepID=UPI0036D95811
MTLTSIRRTGDGPRTTPPRKGFRTRRSGGPWPYLLPVLALIAMWIYGPLLFTMLFSFTHWTMSGSGAMTFVGFANFRRLSHNFGEVALPTAEYVLGLLPFATILPMGVAITLWRNPGRLADAYRGLLFLPVVLAPVATAISWRFLLDPIQGVINTLLSTVGVAGVNWLGDKDTAIWVVVFITGMKVFALNVLLYLAALTALDRRWLDAARLDGATEWEVTRHIVIPLLGRTTVFLSFLCLVLAGHWSFTNISVLTQGGPEASTDNAWYRLYTYGFEYFDTGLASAAATVVMLVLGVAALVQLLAVRRFTRAE